MFIKLNSVIFSNLIILVRFFFILTFLIYVQNILYAQLFDEEVIDTQGLLTRKTEPESFKLDKDGYAHFIMNCPTDTSVEFYYFNNINDERSFGKPIFIKQEKFSQNEAVFLHFFSLLVSKTGLVFYFYMKEYVLHDEKYNQLERQYQIKCLVISPKGFLHEVIVYETPEYILNSKYAIDNNDGIHVAFIMQTDFYDPESPKTINYTYNTSGVFSEPIDISGPIDQLSLHHFQFQMDKYDDPHFFCTNYEGNPMKNYLNHWYFEGSKYHMSKIDSVNLGDDHPWFESFITSKDQYGHIGLLYFSDSLYQSKLLSNHELEKKGLRSFEDYFPSELVDYEVGEFTSFVPVHSSGADSYYYLWELDSAEAGYTFRASINNVGFQFDMDGYLQGIGLREQQGNLFGEIVYLKSIFQLDPLPSLPPDAPQVEDMVFCLEDEKLIQIDGYNITWYENNLDHFIGYGDTLELSHLKSGIHRFLVTETMWDYVSEPDTFFVKVNLPEVDLGRDTTLANSDSIIIEARGDFTSYFWSTGSDSSSTKIIAKEIDSGELSVSVMVENQYGCYSKDTIIVSVEQPLLLEADRIAEVKIYPNPSKDFVVIDVSKLNLSANAEVLLYNTMGKSLFNSPVDSPQISISLKPFKSNVLILKIEDDKRVLSAKILVND